MADPSASQKPARYRSQKRVEPPAQDDAEITEFPVPVDDSVARSKSRYRRRPTASAGSSPPNTAQLGSQASLKQAQSETPSRYRSSPQSPTKQLHQTYVVRTPPQQTGDGEKSEVLGAQQQVSPRSAARVPSSRDVDRDKPRNDASYGTREQAHLQAGKSVRKASDVKAAPRAPTPPPMLPETVPNGQLFPPPKAVEKPARMDGPPQSNNIRATKSMTELRKTLDDDSSDGGCFAIFKRKKTDGAQVTPTDQMASSARPKTANKTDTAYIKPGGGGIVPGTDAPVSAVNAGDRRVLLKCGQSQTFFPVTPTTTPIDLMKSAALCMSEPIDVKSAVILEYFGTVGVQRPLRRYERIRDVMNSWDTDAQNHLLLIDPGVGSADPELTLAGVPAVKPGDESWPVMFSQKPGKWERRIVTLKSDGQIACQKEAGKNKDLLNLCHLSDFDIYTPTQERARKRIKPPKKHCYAIKSQQKSAMFESTQNFVHFFSIGDKQTADNFYAAIHEWRSWYLVNVMGEGRKTAAPAPANNFVNGTTVGGPSIGHRTKESIDSHYQLGSFQPLLDLGDLHKAAEEIPKPAAPLILTATANNPIEQPEARAAPESRPSTRKQPPVSLQNKPILAEDEPLGNFNMRPSMDRQRPPVDKQPHNAKEFKSTGLLGRTYSQRQRDNAEKEAELAQPFTDGPSLLNGGFDEGYRDISSSNNFRRHDSRRQGPSSELRPSKSTRGHTRDESGGLQYSTSRARDKPKPLVDLRPEYREPVHHTRKGRGFQVESPGPNGLVANATSPDEGSPIATAAGAATAAATQEARSHNRSLSLSRSATTSNAQARSRTQQAAQQAQQVQQEAAFTGEGLLAGSHAQLGWGGGSKGRGVMDGSRANGRPMLDLAEQSQFAHGSLLNRVEAANVANGPYYAPVIDRDRREERELRYGEAL